jgi:hypothetical protein
MALFVELQRLGIERNYHLTPERFWLLNKLAKPSKVRAISPQIVVQVEYVKSSEEASTEEEVRCKLVKKKAPGHNLGLPQVEISTYRLKRRVVLCSSKSYRQISIGNF